MIRMIRRLALVVMLSVVAVNVATIGAAEKAPPAPPAAPTMEAVCGEYANMLQAQRHQLELALAETRAHVKVLQARLTPAPATP